MHATLADVIADTAQNSIEAGAKHVSLTLVEDGATIAVTIKDDGRGMDEETQARAFNPFYTEAGKHDIALGQPLGERCEKRLILLGVREQQQHLRKRPRDSEVGHGRRYSHTVGQMWG